MKYILIDDEHSIYKIMYSEIINTIEYDISEIKRISIDNNFLRKLQQLHFDDRINSHIWLPFKNIWNRYYTLNTYDFKNDENYTVIILNGTLRCYYSKKYLEEFRKHRPNVKLVMVMYDSFSNTSASRAISLIPLFDKVFSFDEDDCVKHNLAHIYSTLSYPDFVKKDSKYKNSVYFIGASIGRLSLLQECLKIIGENSVNCNFTIDGVSNEKQKYSNIIKYNCKMLYNEVLMYSFNSDCLLEVLKPGQSGITLRTCEAIMFNKKLITNNHSLKEMPFYNEKFMRIFNTPEDIDLNFVKKPINVDYQYNGFFSPLQIIRKLENSES